MLAAVAERLSIRAAVLTASPSVVEPAHAEAAGFPRGLGAIHDLAVFGAGHPAPNAASVAAGERALALAHANAAAGRGALLVLLSGGASAMLVAPAPGVPLEDKIAAARRLMASGAPIDALNCVRKHLSRIKGGRLAAAARRTATLALSDVQGPAPDDPSVIGSGPTVPDPSTFLDALAVLRHQGVDVPASVRTYLERGARGEVEETIKPGDPRIEDAEYHVIGNRRTAMAGARRAAAALGYHVITIPDATTGEAREAGKQFAAGALRAAGSGRTCLIASGETTVTVRGHGVGGRNQEFALGAAAALGDAMHAACAAAVAAYDVVVASIGTDGIDGPTDAAGAIVDRTTLARARGLGLDWQSALERNDTYAFFARLGDHVLWGPTGTNVGDVHVALIDTTIPPCSASAG